MQPRELVPVRFADEEHFLAPDVAAEVERLRKANRHYAALQLARRGRPLADGPPGAPLAGRIVADGEIVRANLMLMDHATRTAITGKFGEKALDMATYTNLNDANNEVERLRSENRSLNGQVAALGHAKAGARPMLDAAAQAALRDEARTALLNDEAARRSGDTPYTRNLEHLRTAHRDPPGAKH